MLSNGIYSKSKACKSYAQLFGHWTAIHVAISVVKRQSSLDEEEGCFSTGTILLHLIIFYARVLQQLLLQIYYLYYVKLRDRPCHLQTPASEYTPEQIHDLIFVCFLCLARGAL